MISQDADASLFRDSLLQHSAGSGVSLTDEQINAFWVHWCMVLEWNPRCNLTGIRSAYEAAAVHYADAMMAVAHLQGQQTILDIGSGAGYPGLPLAIAMPESQFVLNEIRAKRLSFLRATAAKLALPNVSCTGRDAISADVSQRVDAVVTRAVFSDEFSLRSCMRWLKPGGRLLAFRTTAGDFELSPDLVQEYTVDEKPRVLVVWDSK